MPPFPPHLSELTVTCKQCGSVSMERLDRKEYRCTHCGAITIISDDDAERLEELLRSVMDFSKVAATMTTATVTTTVTTSSGSASTSTFTSASTKSAPDSMPARKSHSRGGCAILVIIVLCFSVPLLVSVLDQGTSAPDSSEPARQDLTVPVDRVELSPLQWDKDDRSYKGTITNHSDYAIDVPHYAMTLYSNGRNGDSARSMTSLDRLLPGEYEPIRFPFSSTKPNSRYEIQQPDQVDRNTDSVARLTLSDQQLVHQDGENYYRFIGVVQNDTQRSVGRPSLLVTLYGPDHRILGYDAANLSDLRPGGKVVADTRIFVHDMDVPVVSYEYLIDADFTDRSR
jgi:hypothetical protein